MRVYEINQKYQEKLDENELGERYMAISIVGRDDPYIIPRSSEVSLRKITLQRALESMLGHIALKPTDPRMKKIGLGETRFSNASGRGGDESGSRRGRSSNGSYTPRNRVNSRST